MLQKWLSEAILHEKVVGVCECVGVSITEREWDIGGDGERQRGAETDRGKMGGRERERESE